MQPSFVVPAEYFYALNAELPIEIGTETRLRTASLLPERDIRDRLRAAIEKGTIASAPAPLGGGSAITPEQAARRLRSLGRVKGKPTCKVPPQPGDDLHRVVASWLDYASSSPADDPSEDIRPFWENLSGADARGHLRLVLAALTEHADPAPLRAALAAVLGTLQPPKSLSNVEDLVGVGVAEWTAVFENDPSLLPAFTSSSGSLAERIAAFLRRLQHFFDLTFPASELAPQTSEATPTFGAPSDDPLSLLFSFGGLTLGQPLDAAALGQAALQVFPGDRTAQAWAVGTVTTLFELFDVTSIGTTSELQMSLIEALYARGFTSKSAIAAMTLGDFTDALVGTVAYAYASTLMGKAGGPAGSTGGGGGPVAPVNAGGTLVNCVPPLHLSPLGPVAYLHELLALARGSSCKEPWPTDDPTTLGAAIADRRGPLGELHATQANVETALPLLDLVNECLEAVAANAPADVAGVVHDTASSDLHGHALKSADAPSGHDPAQLFAALPEHSSPAPEVAEPGGYDKLRSDFSGPILPYSQPLDVCRSYLGELRSTRYAVMRRFRSDITEFVLDPGAEPAAFRRHLWRYPVRWEIAREYLGIAPEEETVFTHDIPDADLPLFWGMPPSDQSWAAKVAVVSTFLEKTGLRYCELVDLAASGWVKIAVRHRGGRREPTTLPDCEPCCLGDWILVVEDGEIGLRKLVVFIRLWRKLQRVSKAGYSFAELRDICEVLVLFRADGSVNPDFLRQLAAFQMLRDHFALSLVDPAAPQGTNASGADRTHLLALWAPPSAPKWGWAVEHLLARIRHYAQARFECGCRTPEFLKLLAQNLTPLSVLAGFDPAAPTATWHAHPTHTLRFAEVLAKIYASSFGVGEILFLFTVADHLNGDDPLPLASANETLDSPLDLPDDDPAHSLWELRRKLLDVDVSDESVASWTWARIDASLREELGFDGKGFASDPLVAFARHFFPSVLERDGTVVQPLDRQYRAPLTTTAPLMWNTPPHGPFRYDVVTKELWTELPLTDEAVLEKLSRARPLTQAERQAVQDLYFAPRVELARLAFLFPSWSEADERLVQETDEEARWAWFQRSFALAHARCRVIAEHLSRHVAHVTGESSTEGEGLAWKLLRHLFADENRGKTSWEADDGTPPEVLWSPPPSGGAFAALLGLLGTGLRGELRKQGGTTPDWVELSGRMDAFGATRNHWNAPGPTILPAMDLALDSDELRFVGVRNGFALQGNDAERLGGAAGFCATWRGVLLVETAGAYTFLGGSPTPEGEEPGRDHAGRQQWRVTLTQGQKSFVVLRHGWPGDGGDITCATPIPLKRGTYEIVVELVQCSPVFDRPDASPAKTGFQLKYAGPDTGERRVTVPARRLFIASKDGPLAAGRTTGKAAEVLDLLYVSTLRDIRRTYQRAFKALLFAHRFTLSAKPAADSGQSEIGYFLARPKELEGLSFFRQGATYAPHRAAFDFNLLPVGDGYHPPAPAQDQRVLPSVRRQQALFDVWERIFDYTELRRGVRRAPEAPAWLAFHEAAENHPDDPAHLLRHLGVDLAHAALVRRFYRQDDVTSAELRDERWATRVWRAEQWIQRMLAAFACRDVRDARPDLWASDDPSKIEASESTSGNEDLTAFVRAGLLENGEPRRYEDLAQLDDGLRQRARAALVAFLTRLDRVPLPWGGFAKAPNDLSELLLIDVEAGGCERASRIEEAISAVQLFVQRARLGLEPAFTVDPELTLLWDRRFATFGVWQACKRRELYEENTIAWDERVKARASESFRFFEDRLRSSALTIAAPAGLTIWSGTRPPAHPGVDLLQAQDPSTLAWLEPPRDGFSLLGAPERHARPSWLTSPARAGRRGGDGTPREPNRPEVPGVAGPAAALAVAGVPVVKGKLPFWIEAAIRLGAKFVRVAAAGLPAGSATFGNAPSDASGCCADCCTIHPPVVDEYYFWLLDARVFERVTQDADIQVDGASPDEGSAWHDEGALPKLLYWKSAPIVHLFWARVHDGELKQMRRSTEGVRVAGSTLPDLIFVGRSADSLRFEVAGGIAPPGHEAFPAPGFRYDLPTDTAEVMPPVVPEGGAPATFLSALPAFPYFLYFTPGAPLVPPTYFSQALAAATVLRAHCRFEAALKWYESVFDPLRANAAWCRRAGELSTDRPSTTAVAVDTTSRFAACCKGGAVADDVARDRAVTLEYFETMLDWGDALMRRHSPESFQQARLVFDVAAKGLGPVPRTVVDHDEVSPPQTVESFVAAAPALNPRLMELYERLEDRRASIHACLDARRLRNGAPNIDMPYFGDVMAPAGNRAFSGACDEAVDCLPPCPYRFVFLVQKALERTADVRSLGALLLAAYEKGDAEYLASLRAGQERQLLTLAIETRKDQWREADWMVQSLRKTKEIARTRLAFFEALLANGLNTGEIGYEAFTGTSMASRAAGNVSEGIAQGMGLVPDMWAGVAGIAGTPLFFQQFPIGSKLAGGFATAARILNALADIASSAAGLSLTEGGWERREEEWRHQVDVVKIEIEQIERQILAAERRSDAALRELSEHQRRIEHSIEVEDYLRDKLTAHELYLWLQKETAALYAQSYELALRSARQAERAFVYERGHTTRRFVEGEMWDDRREGLLAGERLELALRRMEKVYHCENVREYELTKHLSLRQLFPAQLLQLRLTGHCEIELPEWLFDLDYPGHYMRRIKSVSLSIPCVVGPFAGVHCRLTLLSSATRIDPRLAGPLAGCCPRPAPARGTSTCASCGHAYSPEPPVTEKPIRSGYAALPDDTRIVKQYAATEAIATSSGQNDSGLFELSFRDERYLPFELAGAVSRWRIELPAENNFFDLATVTDVVMHLSYTAREGGNVLRRAASEASASRVPDGGHRLLDVRTDLRDLWHRFTSTRSAPRSLDIEVTRDLFPFLPGRPSIEVVTLDLFFELACGGREVPADVVVELTLDERDGCPHDHESERPTRLVHCLVSAKWPGLHHGVVSVKLDVARPPHARPPIVRLAFPGTAEPIVNAFVVFGYRMRSST